MRNYLNILLTIILFFVSGNIFSQSPADSLNQNKVMTLQEVILALDKNPTLQAFDNRINSFKAYAKGARSLEAPRVTGGFWMTPYARPKMNNNGMDMGSNQDEGSLMIGVEQMIMNPSKRKAEENYMLGMSSVEQQMKNFERQEMVSMAKKAYYEWIILEKKLRVLEESEELLKLMIKSGEINYTYNQGGLSRIYKAQSELYNIQNMQIMARNEIRQMNIELNTLMNIEKSIVYKIDTSYTIAEYDVLPVDTTAIASNRSDIRNIEESIKLNTLRTNFELSKRKPDFGIQFAHMNGFGEMPNQFNLMGMVTIPIAPWSSKGYKANVEGIKFESASLRQRREAIVNEAAGNLQKLRTELANKKKQIEMYEKNIIPALEKNYNTSLIAFEHMKEDMFMTIDAWMALKMAKIEYLEQLGQLLKLQADYERQIEKQ
ncbi:MAG: TolC family protein [Cytophagaceae bacterium]|nr:TolC family protein [Cytophagaceae bacterium]